MLQSEPESEVVTYKTYVHACYTATEGAPSLRQAVKLLKFSLEVIKS